MQAWKGCATSQYQIFLVYEWAESPWVTGLNISLKGEIVLRGSLQKAFFEPRDTRYRGSGNAPRHPQVPNRVVSTGNSGRRQERS
jgi:hypothetical protein